VDSITDREEDMWKKNWEEGNVVNEHLINDPTQRVAGFDCQRAVWTSLNRIRTEQGKCNYLLHKWKIKDSPHCNCGQIQTIRHIVEECPQTRYERGITGLHRCDEEAIDWLCNLAVRL
jgi:hypothetical protein